MQLVGLFHNVYGETSLYHKKRSINHKVKSYFLFTYNNGMQPASYQLVVPLNNLLGRQKLVLAWFPWN